MKLLMTFLTLAVLSLVAVQPALAHTGEDCTHDMATIESLHHCVQHALEQGHIDNPGIAKGLLAKVDAAQAAFDRGQAAVAMHTLQAFIQEVNAQAGKHIITEHAGHLVEHAQMVVKALGG